MQGIGGTEVNVDKVDKEWLIGRFNFLQRARTFPDPSWNKETRINLYYEFVEFIDAVRHCGYTFVTDYDGDLLIATDVVPLYDLSASGIRSNA